jgi:hypothetical protein
MKPRIAAIGSFAPAGAAVVGSVALSLLVLHPPPAGLLPGTAPANPGHVAALVLPAPHVARPPANAQLDVPRPTPAAIATVTPRREVQRPAPPSEPTHRPTQSPPPPPVVVTVPTPVTQPVTTPVTTPTVIPANNGRWSSPQTKAWKGAAAKQALRVQKGKPPWAGPKKNQPTTTPTATVPAAVPDTSSTPPGQTKTPPGQEKKAKSPHG